MGGAGSRPATSWATTRPTSPRSSSASAALRHIADRLALPPHVLGITDHTDNDFRAVIPFGRSTVRLAEIARLEARTRDGYAEREALRLLADARLGLGTALGNMLPEERLATAALDCQGPQRRCILRRDPALTTTALRMHGNELRKARLVNAAVNRLVAAASLASNRTSRVTVLPLLARVVGALGIGPLLTAPSRKHEPCSMRSNTPVSSTP